MLQVRWDGTGGPWDHTIPKCPLCPLHHGTTVHKRLIHYMRWKVAFRNMWLSTWGPWQDTVTAWWNKESAPDLQRARYVPRHVPKVRGAHVVGGNGPAVVATAPARPRGAVGRPPALLVPSSAPPPHPLRGSDGRRQAPRRGGGLVGPGMGQRSRPAVPPLPWA